MECPNCHGYGFLDGATCLRCDGEGWLCQSCAQPSVCCCCFDDWEEVYSCPEEELWDDMGGEG